MATRDELVAAGLGYLLEGAYGGSTLAEAIISEQLAGRGPGPGPAPAPPAPPPPEPGPAPAGQPPPVAVYAPTLLSPAEVHDRIVSLFTAREGFPPSDAQLAAMASIVGYVQGAYISEAQFVTFVNQPALIAYADAQRPAPIAPPPPQPPPVVVVAPPAPPAPPVVVAPPPMVPPVVAAPLPGVLTAADVHDRIVAFVTARLHRAPTTDELARMATIVGYVQGASITAAQYAAFVANPALVQYLDTLPSLVVAVPPVTVPPPIVPPRTPPSPVPPVVLLPGPSPVPTPRLAAPGLHIAPLDFSSSGGEGEFLGTAIVAGVLAVLGLIGKLFGGGGDLDGLRRDFQSLRNQVIGLAAALVNYATQGAATDGKTRGVIGTILNGILGPLINAIIGLVEKVHGFLSDWFGPLLRLLKRVQDLIRRIYTTWLKPILAVIDTIRALLKILELFHVKWAQVADDALGRLEAKLSAPILFALAKVNEVIGIVNRIVTLDGVFQRTMLLKSTWNQMGAILAQAWHVQVMKINPVEARILGGRTYAAIDPNQVSAELAASNRGEGGHMDAYTTELVSVFRQAAGLDPFKADSS